MNTQPRNQYDERPREAEHDNLLGLPKNQDYGTMNEYIQPTDVNSYIRGGFVKKLLLTAFVIIAAIESPAIKSFMLNNKALGIICIVVNIVTAITLFCCGVHRTVPINYILLLVFTLTEAYMAAFTCIRYTKNSVLVAALLTCAMVVGLTIYAITTSTDFTMMGGLLFVGSMVLLAAGLIGIFIQVKIFHLIISIFSVLLFSVYLIYDTQLIIGGKHERASALEIDDYILGAIALYIDIVVLFLEILKIFGTKD